VILISGLALGVLVVPCAAEAQQAGRVYRIGYLAPTWPAAAAHLTAAVRDGLRDLGWGAGQNILIEDRWAEGSADRLPVLAAELVRLKVDLIVAGATPGALAATSATREIPIVFQMVRRPNRVSRGARKVR
jgi:putative ABC transport system substrate-binding protein